MQGAPDGCFLFFVGGSLNISATENKPKGDFYGKRKKHTKTNYQTQKEGMSQ